MPTSAKDIHQGAMTSPEPLPHGDIIGIEHGKRGFAEMHMLVRTSLVLTVLHRPLLDTLQCPHLEALSSLHKNTTQLDHLIVQTREHTGHADTSCSKTSVILRLKYIEGFNLICCLARHCYYRNDVGDGHLKTKKSKKYVST